MYLRTLALVALLLALPGCSYLPSLSSDRISISGEPEAAASINEFRAAHGLKPLRSDPKLTRLAAGHAADMARRNSLDHNGFMERRGPAGARAGEAHRGKVLRPEDSRPGGADVRHRVHRRIRGQRRGELGELVQRTRASKGRIKFDKAKNQYLFDLFAAQTTMRVRRATEETPTTNTVAAATNSVALALGQAATHAPHPMQAAASMAQLPCKSR